MGQMTGETGWDEEQEVYHEAEGEAEGEAKPSSSFPHLAQGRSFLGWGWGTRGF